MRVIPTQPNVMAKVLGVYANAELAGSNYYMPGAATTPYRRGDSYITLTTAMPAGTTTAYIKHEIYPKVDVGIPVSEVTVSYLGETKTLAAAKTAGWVNDSVWRYDAATQEYVRIHATAAGAERALKAWSGHWIKALVNCSLNINPNTTYNGTVAGAQVSALRELMSVETLDMPPPAPK